jgi:hypothetical protein
LVSIGKHIGRFGNTAKLKGTSDSRQLCIEIRGKPVGCNAKTTRETFALRCADLANPSVLENS